MSINLGAPKSNDDEYYTPQYAIEMLKDYLPDKNKICWECFTSGNHEYIESPNYIKSLGYKVIADGEDFWKSNKGHWVCSNPPYYTPRGQKNIKTRIIERLCELDKPFCLLLPTLYLHTKTFKEVKDKFGNFQIIMPAKKIQFYKVIDGKKVQPKKGCNFYTLWVCYKMNLPSDWILI